MGERISLEKLNLRAPKTFNYADEAETIPPRIRFYCVCEGATEESYFFGVRNNKVKLKIKNDVFIEVIEKREGQESFSHPMQLLNACLFQMGRIDQDGNEISENEWEKYCQWDNFDAKIDQVCIIFDRDYRNLDHVIDEIFAQCNRHGIKIVISNPNFELWLLMHFPNIKQYAPEMLLSNQKNLRHQLFKNASVNKKYLEILVSRNADGYTKGSKIRFERFLPLIDTAIEQAKLYDEDPRKLTYALGTSVGRLMEEIR